METATNQFLGQSLCALHTPFHWIQQTCGVVTVIIPILQVNKLRVRVVD